MGTLIETPDKKMHTILGTDDLLELVDEYMGYEVKEAIVEAMNEIEEVHYDDEECIRELNDQCGKLWHKHREVMQEIDEEQLALNDLITAKELDRKAISNVCGELSGIVRGELN